jgi:hypothetical protein
VANETAVGRSRRVWRLSRGCDAYFPLQRCNAATVQSLRPNRSDPVRNAVAALGGSLPKATQPVSVDGKPAFGDATPVSVVGQRRRRAVGGRTSAARPCFRDAAFARGFRPISSRGVNLPIGTGISLASRRFAMTPSESGSRSGVTSPPQELDRA